MKKNMNRVNFKVQNFKQPIAGFPKPKSWKEKNVEEFVKKEPNKNPDWTKYYEYAEYGVKVEMLLGKGIFGQIRDKGENTITGTVKNIPKDLQIIENSEKVKSTKKPKDPDKIEIVYNPEGYRNTHGFNMYHGHKSYRLNGYNIDISDNLGGCGVQQLYNWINSVNNENISVILKEIIKTLHDGVGMVMCQLGQDYFHTEMEKALTNEGFIYTEYNNWQHGSNYKQRMYMLTIKEQKKDGGYDL